MTSEKYFSPADSPNVESARGWISKQQPAIEGNGGDSHTFFVAATLVHKFGLTEEDALEVIQEWNDRCVPPWTEFELRRKLRYAASGTAPSKTENSPRGAAATGAVPGHQGTKKQKPVFRPMVLKRIAARAAAIHNLPAYLKTVSPVTLDGQDSVSVLRQLYPMGSGEKVLIFSEMKSQGQFVFDADASATIQNYDLPSGPGGVWFLPQPVTGGYHPNPRMDGKLSRRSEEAVTDWRYAVLESDKADPQDWLRCLVQMPLRISCVCESGGRSVNALVRIDATSKLDWDAKVATIKPVLVTLGADPAALTAVRLTRLPQAMRGDRCQCLLYLNPNPNDTSIIAAAAKANALL